MKRKAKILGSCMLTLMLAAGWTMALAAEKKKEHPKLSVQEQYIACDECHREATPDLYKEWFDSGHGMAMVKCYQCHGSFERFRVTPTRQDCAVCHENMMKKCPQDKPCWQCHVPHTFKMKQ